MKFIGKILASILAVAFFLISFTSVFLYSTINFQTHSIYTEYVENSYLKLKEIVSNEIDKMKNKSSQSEEIDNPTETQKVIQNAPTPFDSLPINEIMEIINNIIAKYGSDLDIISIITGSSYSSLDELLNTHKEDVDKIADEICEKYDVSKESLINQILEYFSSNNVDTEEIKDKTSISDLISSFIKNDNAKDIIEKTINESDNKDPDNPTNPISDVIYDVIDKKAQQMLFIIKEFLLTPSFENAFKHCVSSTSIDLFNAIENNSTVIFTDEIINSISGYSDELNDAFKNVLQNNNMTYLEFTVLTDEVLYNSLDNYKLGTFNALTKFSESLKRLVNNYSKEINESLNLDNFINDVSTKVPHPLLKISSIYVTFLFSSNSLLYIILSHVAILLILCFASFSLSYGFKLTGILGIVDGLFLLFIMFLSNHISSFFATINEGVVFIDMLVQSLKTSWKICMIWCLSIGVGLIIVSLIIAIINRPKAKQ